MPSPMDVEIISVVFTPSPEIIATPFIEGVEFVATAFENNLPFETIFIQEGPPGPLARDIDGGSAASVYLNPQQQINGGGA